MHLVMIGSVVLLAVGIFVGLGILVVVFTLPWAWQYANLQWVRVLLGALIAVICITTGLLAVRRKPVPLQGSAGAVIALATLALALDWYQQGHLYLTGDFGPVALIMIAGAVILASGHKSYVPKDS